MATPPTLMFASIKHTKRKHNVMKVWLHRTEQETTSLYKINLITVYLRSEGLALVVFYAIEHERVAQNEQWVWSIVMGVRAVTLLTWC